MSMLLFNCLVSIFLLSFFKFLLGIFLVVSCFALVIKLFYGGSSND